MPGAGRHAQPPLNALRAFEVAARLQSFAAAAEELNVTPAAVAQQVRKLESWLGVALFERHARGIRLTATARAVLPRFEAAFDAVGAAVQTLRVHARPNQVSIAALPGIAQFWLSPLLPDIHQRFPDILVSVAALQTPPNLAREPYDISLYLEPGVADEDGSALCQDVLFPVCSPDYRARLMDVNTPGTMTLLHDSDWRQDWSDWLQGSGEIDRYETRDAEFSLYSLAIDEARNGAGLLMGHEMLVRPLLNTGQLVAPFHYRLVRDNWLTLRVNPAGRSNPNVSSLTEWLRETNQEPRSIA